jgi:hypothetical protein
MLDSSSGKLLSDVFPEQHKLVFLYSIIYCSPEVPILKR